MNLEQALYAELKTIAGITVWPMNAPEGTTAPYVTYETSDLNEDKTLDGYLPHGNTECTVDVFGATFPLMKSTSALVKSRLKSFEGRTIGTLGPYIQELTFSESNPEMYEPEINLYRKSINFKVYF